MTSKLQKCTDIKKVNFTFDSHHLGDLALQATDLKRCVTHVDDS